ncbi:MAG: hypothetical protein ACK4GJ_01825 [bacterium]
MCKCFCFVVYIIFTSRVHFANKVSSFLGMIKENSARLRPQDLMTAHTVYIISAKKL